MVNAFFQLSTFSHYLNYSKLDKEGPIKKWQQSNMDSSLNLQFEKRFEKCLLFGPENNYLFKLIVKCNSDSDTGFSG